MTVARIGLLALVAAGPLLLGAGAGSRIVAFSPENREATDFGPLTAYLEDKGAEGDIWLKLGTGEILKGRFEVKAGGSVGALGKAYGIDRPGGAYIGAGRPLVGGSPAFIDMKRPSGATVHCEVMNDDANVKGSGVCLFSNGAVYRVLY